MLSFPRSSHPDAAHRHATATIALHWIIAALIVALLVLGWAMTRMAPGSELQFALYQLHKSLGITVLLLSLARLAWRVASPAPPPAATARWERRAARAMHAALLVLTLAIPLVGWALVSASRLAIPTELFGIVPFPHLPGLGGLAPAAKIVLEARLASAHALLAGLLAVLGALHAAAAIFHHVVRGDDVLRRMLPRRA
jgi:cytochrome b561